MAVPHPIPYQGSKRALAPDIVAYFPVNLDRLVEPFAGSAAVTLASAYYGRAGTFLLNDINRPLIGLWEEIINRPEAIAKAYEQLWVEQQAQAREFYDIVRARFNQMHRADCFLYLLARCVKASVRYGPDGNFNQSPDNRRKGARPSEMRTRIMSASQLLRGKTRLTSVDYREVLAEATPSDVVYMDPPYQGVCEGKDHRYMQRFSFDDFVEALRQLNARGLSFIVSYDGRTGDKTFGRPLPTSLGLLRIEIDAGRSSQATLLGRDANTVESLYLSPALIERIAADSRPSSAQTQIQCPLLTSVT